MEDERQSKVSCSRLSSHQPAIPTSSRSWLHHRQPSLPHSLLVFILLSCCVSFTSAMRIHLEEEMVEPIEEEPRPPTEDLGSAFHRLAQSGTILVDLSPPPVPGDWVLPSANTIGEDLRRRDDPLGAGGQSTGSSTTLSTTTTAATTTKSSSTSASTTSGSTTSSSTAAAATSALPTPFDIGFSSNITTSCASFMNAMLSNSTFKSCLPFSLLLQNSNSFFQASKSLVRITQTLDYTCAASQSICPKLMSSFASNITTTANCLSDYNNENPLIQQARLGLLAYKPLYTASCLRNPTTSSYCYADAITNATNPTDSYIYFLPLNQSLVGGSQPTCNSCLKNTMAVFEAASSDRSSALASDYVAAAIQVNVNCGPGFVNSSLAAAVVSGSTPLLRRRTTWSFSDSGSLYSIGLITLVVFLGNGLF